MKKSLFFLTTIFWSAWSFGQVVTTFAGSGVRGSTDATGNAASFNGPVGVVLDASGTVYVADSSNNKIRKITPTGAVTTFVGSGFAGSTDGTGTTATLSSPYGAILDPAGTVYVVDVQGHRVRKITPAGEVTTFAGSGAGGSTDATGVAASFHFPTDIAIDGDGNLYVVDSLNHKIRKITPAGVVTTLAGSGFAGSTDGTGTAAKFNNPDGVAVDAEGIVYVADGGNHKIRKITPAGVVTTLAGSGTQGSLDATGTLASFNFPTGVTVDTSGNVYVADYSNNKIRKITAAGVVTTVAGSGTSGSTDATGTAASFNFPKRVTLDSTGNLYVTDNGNQKIRKITMPVLNTNSFEVSKNIKIYPNPAVDAVTVEVAQLTNASLAVYDALGKLVLTQKINSSSNLVDIHALAAGVYVFKITSTEGVAINKVVKK